MNCKEYLDCVAADVDGALGELAEPARLHVTGCARCRAERDRQRAVRDLLRSRRLTPELPLELRARVLASLEEVGREEARALRRWWFRLGAAALAAAAVALVVVTVLWNRGGPLTPLIREYRLASRGALKMTVETGAREELEDFYRRYRGEGIAAHVIDLSPAGFRLVGGVLENFPRRRARITVYSDGEHIVLCDFLRADRAEIEVPADGRPSFFRAGGLSFCARRVGDHVCVLVTSMPVEAFRSRLGEAAAAK